MKYENQRPDLADQIKALVQSANSVKTVPHGIKTVNPGEGLQLLSSDGAEIFWDWETAAEYDSRISEGRAAIDQAQAELAQARLDLDAGAARVTENRQLLDALGPRVDAAQSQVTQTAEDLTAVDTRLTTTAGNLSALQTTVSTVETAANTASTTASDAYSTAQSAQQTAETTASNFTALDAKLDAALASSDGLYDDSSYELGTRNTAGVPVIDVGTGAATGSKVAEFTKGSGNGNVFTYWEYKPVAPGHVYRIDMKARSVSGTPVMESWANYRRADGTTTSFVTVLTMDSLTSDWARGYAEWTAPDDAVEARFFPIMPNAYNVEGAKAYVDDHQVTDTTEQATLRLQVEDAKREAEDAAKAAQAANTAAGLAQKAADGKTTITTNTSNPAGLGVAVGDIHVRMTSMSTTGQIIGQWRWDGSNWVSQSIGSDFLAEVNVVKLTGTFANFTQHLSAGAITTPYLTVGIGPNVVPNGGGQAQGGWENFGHNTSGPGQNNGYPGSFWTLGTSTKTSARFPLTPGEWGFTASAKGQHDNGRAYIQINCYGIDGERITGTYPVSNQVIPNGTWKDFSSKVTVPAGVVEADIRVYANHINGVQAEDYQWFTGFSLKEYVSGELLINGTVTGDKVDAESVAAKVGKFVKVQAVNVEVTEDLATRVVNSMTANTKNLVVTESAILQHTTLLGTTVADELNVRKLIRGRDAILDGTVDVAQLNVTGSMSAEIVRAMDTTTKRLIVTEDAILNRATVVESLVTPELISEKANIGDLAARMITSGLLQTSTAANRGVKIDSSGIRAWDTAGKQTVQINGTNNYLTGTFATAEKEQRVEIKTGASNAAADFYGSTSTTDHLGVWHQSDIGADSVSKIISFNQIAQHANSPGMLMYPFRGEFTFAGRWARESDTVKFFFLQNSTGLAGGDWVDLTYRYAKPFTTSYSYRMPFLSVEAATGRDCIAMVREQTASEITFRVVNKSAGPSGLLVARGAVFNMNSEIYNRYW